jgi:predicted membrane channel-forming protein YqfA (hemolysin III family)
LGTRTFEAEIEDPLPAAAPRFRGVAHLAAFVAAVPLGVVLVLHARAGVAQVGAFAFAASVGVGATALLTAGGIAYTACAIVYARRRPDSFPSTFGYHEVFHSLVVVALTCPYATIAFFVVPQA